MRTAFHVLCFAFSLGIAGSASASHGDAIVSPDEFRPNLYVEVKKVNRPGASDASKVTVARREHVATGRSEPIKKNAWGGIPCITLPDGTPQCFGQPAIPPPTEPGMPTEGEIVTAVREIGLPSLKIRIQPGDETLVNLDTIFHTRPQPFSRNVTLLGFDIDLTATPTGFTWRHGDGTTHTTRTPGRAYPAKDVTWRYQKVAKNLHPSVDVTYTVRYRIDRGAWQNLSQTLQANGPTGQLDVKEATPVLTRP